MEQVWVPGAAKVSSRGFGIGKTALP